MRGGRGLSAVNIQALLMACGAICISLQAPQSFAQISQSSPEDVAQTSPRTAVTAGAQIYAPDFFQRFAPKTAADMIRNVPGFSVDGGERRRGFGQGGGNVLINGRRMSGKSNSAIGELENISAEQVVRIEIIDGATLAIPGLSGQVANVVKQTDVLSGTWQWNPQLRADTKPVYDRGRISFSGETGALAYNFGLRADGGSGAGRGLERVTDANGQALDLRDDRSRGGGRAYEVNGGLTYVDLKGDVLNANLTASTEDFGDFEVSKRYGPNQPDRLRYSDSGFQGKSAELGADYEFALGPGRMKLIGLQSLEEGTEIATLAQYIVTQPIVTGARFVSNYEQGESIARGEYALPPMLGGDWQVAAEGAFNFLEIDSSLFDRLIDGGFGNEDVFAGSRVEETRGEISLSHNRQLAEGLDLQASIAAERSEISQTGGNGKVREFVRPKGFASLAWKATPDLDLSMRLAREVGQLDFDDFIASTNLSDGFSNAGNVDLVPEQSWVIEIEATRRMGGWGTLTFGLSAEEIEDIVDQVLILSTDGLTVVGEAPGNIDSAQRYGASLNGTVNFDPVGFKGAKLDLELEFNESEVMDPLTGDKRRVSDTNLFALEASFRHDVPQTDWAYGVFYEQFRRERNFRLDQVSQFIATPGFAGAYVEHKDVFGLTARLTVGNLAHSNEDYGRTVYVDRRDGPIDFVEFRSFNFQNIYNLRLSGKF